MRRTSISRRVALGVAVVATLLVAAAAPVAAGTPSPAVTLLSGFVAVRSPGLAGYVPADVDQGMSFGGPATVTRIRAGEHLIAFPGLQYPGGIAHAAPLGTRDRYCSVVYWSGSGPEETVKVRCTDAAGTRRDTPFMVSWFGNNGIPSGDLGYVWASSPGAASYDPDPQYSFTSGSGTNHIVRLAKGDYRVTFAGIGSATGSAVVSAYGIKNRVCRVVGWSKAGNDERVRVRCQVPHGGPADSRFSLTWMTQNTLDYLSSGAYLKAAGTLASERVDDDASTYRSGSGQIKVIRTSVGHWKVTFATMPRGGAAFVSGLGTNGLRCRVTGIRTTGSPPTVSVACRNAAGAVANGPFAMSLVTYPLAP